MERIFNPPLTAANFSSGYWAQLEGRRLTDLSQPSANVRLTRQGQAYTRPGYLDTGWDINQAGYVSSPYRMIRYAITLFAINTKVYYRKDSNGLFYDTGIAITAGKESTSTFLEYAGDIFVMNVTDGIQRLAFTSLASAAASADTTIALEVSTGVKFPAGAHNLRINGVNISIASGATDTETCTTTVGANYVAGEIAMYSVALSSAPKGSKAAQWKESMNVVGVTAAFTGYDLPRHTHFYSDFAVATTAGMAKFYAFSGGKSGAQPLGVTGVLTNVVATVDRLFLFKEDESYFIRVGDVVISDGTRPANIFSPRYGCVNQFCAVEMEGNVVFLTKNRRVIKSSSNAPTTASGGTTGTGVPAQGQMYPDESFDRAIFDLLLLLDDDQTGARMHYWTTGRLLFIVCKIGGQKVALIYDNNVGVWLPPSTNFSFNGFFEISGALYAVSDNDDTIYQLETGSADAGAPIECFIATGIIRVQKGKGNKGFATCDFEETEFIGGIAQGTDLFYHPIIDTAKIGDEKTVSAVDVATFGSGTPIGSVGIGGIVIGGSGQVPERAPFSSRLANVPSVGTGIQLVWRTAEDGHSFGIDGYKIYGREFSDSFAETH